MADASKMAGLTDAVRSYIAQAWDSAAKEKKQLMCQAVATAAQDDASYKVRLQRCNDAHAPLAGAALRLPALPERLHSGPHCFPTSTQACIAWCQSNGRYVDTEFPPDKCAARRRLAGSGS